MSAAEMIEGPETREEWLASATPNVKVASHFAPSHVDYCPLRHLKAGELVVETKGTYGHTTTKTRIAICRCPYKSNRLAEYAARIADQRSRGLDPWSEGGFAERMTAKRAPKRQAKVADAGERTLEDAAAELVKARKKVAQLEAEVDRLFAQEVKAGRKLAELGRILGVSRQRAHQMARELDA